MQQIITSTKHLPLKNKRMEAQTVIEGNKLIYILQDDFKPIKVKLKKEFLNDIRYELAYSVYNFCRKYKIKVEEPWDKKKERYNLFILHIDTFTKAFAFSNRFLKVFKDMKPELSTTH